VAEDNRLVFIMFRIIIIENESDREGKTMTNKPKMILFDYGNTLIYEPGWDNHGSVRALYSLIESNPYNVTVDELDSFILTLFEDIRRLRGEFIEIHEYPFLRYVLEYYNLKLSVPFAEAEWLMWNGISSGKEMPGAYDMLKYLDEHGIRTGIISNLCWSGNTLKRRLNQFFPEHKFEFVMTSSEYIFRKPERHIFELALRKAELSPYEVWYAGNSLICDVKGAHEADMFAVHIDEPEINAGFKKEQDTYVPDFEYLHIEHWSELSKFI